MSCPENDLVVLAPDRDMKAAIEGLLSRPRALRIRDLSFDVLVYRSGREPYGSRFRSPAGKGARAISGAWDAECFSLGHDLLRSRTRVYAHALVIFDRRGCGQEHSSREEIERIVTDNLSRSGWGDRAAAVVLDPELEVWVWSDSPHVEKCLGWQAGQISLQTWLRQQDLWSADAIKPENPKEAVRRALRHAKKPPSSAIFKQLAKCVSLRRCTDPAFLRLRDLLQRWFPAQVS